MNMVFEPLLVGALVKEQEERVRCCGCLHLVVLEQVGLQMTDPHGVTIYHCKDCIEIPLWCVD